MKNIVLIRHGESLGQTAHQRAQHRKDPSLIDCFLSPKGIRQAKQLGQQLLDDDSTQFDLVCVSPLTRALTTCMLGLGHLLQEYDEEEVAVSAESVDADNSATTTPPPFICHPGLAETGGIPENHGRPISVVVSDIKKKLKLHAPHARTKISQVDFSLLDPQQEGGIPWPPSRHDEKLTRLDFLRWLNDRPEQNIAIVCHYNVIMALLRYQIDHVPNSVPIACVMREGDLDSLYIAGHESMEDPPFVVTSPGTRRKRKKKSKR